VDNALLFIIGLHTALMEVPNPDLVRIMDRAFGGVAEFVRLRELAHRELEEAKTWRAAAEMQAFAAGEPH